MIVSLIVTLVIVGVVLYLIDLLPIDGVIKQIIRVLVILFVLLWLLSVFGVISGFPEYGHVHLP